jgi:hypothetical protein
MNEDGHVSNPRRGLLAAGLTAAVVGSLGVVWTFNANAAETAPAEIPAAVEADAEPVPPPLLPWGDEPEPLKLAKPDANSAAVAAAGADAAVADTNGSQIAGPKGGDFDSDVPGEAPVPPVPPTAGVTTAKAAAGSTIFHYAAADLTGETDGTWANLTIEKPVLNTGDNHSLAEIAVRSGDVDHKQTVEVGWTVDRSLNKDNDPHLFVYHWVDGKETCYNICGFVPYSAATIKPGATLPVGAQKRFGVQHSDGVWWIAYDSAWIGFFPDTIWGGRYTKGGFTQWFGEVASPLQFPCTDMGNGQVVTDEIGGRIGSISMVNGPEVKPTFWVSNPDNKDYTVNVQPEKSLRTFRYGGPGASGCPA